MRVESTGFTNNVGRRLAARVCRGDSSTGTGVIFSHGLFASKDGYKITRLAGAIVDAGADLLTFDFTGAGESGGSPADLSILQEVEDLAAAVRFFRERGIERIHLMGSSMGAAVTLLYASRRDESVISLMLIAVPVDIRRLLVAGAGIADPSALPDGGLTPLEGVPIGNSFYREAAGIDMAAAVRSIGVPVLAIHGGRDAVVDPTNVGLLKEYLTPPLRAVFISDGDHSLTRPGDIRLMAEEIAAWIRGEYAAALRRPR